MAPPLLLLWLLLSQATGNVCFVLFPNANPTTTAATQRRLILLVLQSLVLLLLRRKSLKSGSLWSPACVRVSYGNDSRSRSIGGGSRKNERVSMVCPYDSGRESALCFYPAIRAHTKSHTHKTCLTCLGAHCIRGEDRSKNYTHCLQQSNKERSPHTHVYIHITKLVIENPISPSI